MWSDTNTDLLKCEDMAATSTSTGGLGEGGTL